MASITSGGLFRRLHCKFADFLPISIEKCGRDLSRVSGFIFIFFRRGLCLGFQVLYGYYGCFRGVMAVGFVSNGGFVYGIEMELYISVEPRVFRGADLYFGYYGGCCGCWPSLPSSSNEVFIGIRYGY